MCTVTYLPTDKDRFVLTSNRDERSARPTVPPLAEEIGGATVFFPKDLEGGGTWIAAADTGRICCLLNGAFEIHPRNPPYTRSRGKVLLEAFEYENIQDFFGHIRLEGVEPFTLIAAEAGPRPALWEFRWDAARKHLTEPAPDRPHIWSSVTLYGPEVRARREEWFRQWLAKTERRDRETVFHFHSATHGKDPANDVVMERAQGLQTVSITQVEAGVQGFVMYYHDLLKARVREVEVGVGKI